MNNKFIKLLHLIKLYIKCPYLFRHRKLILSTLLWMKSDITPLLDENHLSPKFLARRSICSLNTILYLNNNNDYAEFRYNIVHKYIYNNIPSDASTTSGYWYPVHQWDKRLEWIDYHINLLNF